MRKFRVKMVLLIMLLAAGSISWAQTGVYLVLGSDTIDLICEGEGTYYFIGNNDDSIPGTFKLYEADSEIHIEGHIFDEDLEDDTAQLDPLGLNGEYEVQYSYMKDLVTISVSALFSVGILDVIEIVNLPDSVCKNDEPFPLVPEPALSDPGAIYTFTGLGISGNQTDGYYYTPGNEGLPVGWNDINLEYTSSNGCEGTGIYSIFTGFIPTLNFSSSPACIPLEGGEVIFNNLTSGKFSVEEWSWDFGDPASGSENVSHEENPVHFYSRPGSWEIHLYAETYDGCSVSLISEIDLSDEPDADFTVVNDCFLKGELTSFLDRSVSEYANIDTLLWTFRTTGGGVLGQIGSASSEDTIRFPFTSMNDYSVTLQVENELGCTGNKTKIISLKPTLKLQTEGYLETFDEPPENWLIESDNGAESWVLGEPDFSGFEALPGDLAWYTDLTGTPEGYLENSWIQSPCFDFSDLSSPLLRLDIMKSFVPGTDGAVLQYQERVSDGWETLGTVDGGINWYNSFGIFNQPGGSSIGWGLPLFEPDIDWLKAAYSIDLLGGVRAVKFRVAVGTGPEQAIGNQGFAFDNLFLGERVKNSLIEYFTNSASAEALEADRVMRNFVGEHYSLVLDLQYHMDYPGDDPMNTNNPVPPSVRAFNYGVPGVPYAVLNGGAGPESRYDFSDPSEQPDGDQLMESSLEIPPFDLKLTVNFLESSAEGSVKVTCKERAFSANIQLYIVVLEKMVTAYTGANGSTSFRNVVLDILPSATGKLLGNEWGAGVSQDLNFIWEYAAYMEDLHDLMFVAFVMDRDHDEILQSTYVEHTPSVGVRQEGPFSGSLAIYPNPAREYVYINFGSRVKLTGRLDLFDLSGRSVSSTEVQPGYTIQRLDISGLSEGIYLVSWSEAGILKARGKLVHAR